MLNFGWVDFSREDRRKTLTILQTLRDEGAVDELGIGVVRDAFADYFFPGTSTLHTRAKYLVLVPYIVKDILSHRKGMRYERLLERIDASERVCAESMYNEHKNNGLIGKDAIGQGGWVSRSPSDIYWNGIRTYGIFDTGDWGRLSLKNYVQLFCEMKEETSSNTFEELESNDEKLGDSALFPYFDIEKIYKKDWRENLSIDLTKKEAVYLKNKIRESIPDSLMNILLEKKVKIFQEEIPNFEKLFDIMKKKVPETLANTMKLASNFNCLVYAMRVQYNYILHKHDDAESKWNYVKSKEFIERIEQVNLTSIKALPFMMMRKKEVFTFLDSMKDAFVNKNFKRTEELIRKRECDIKDENRSKLLHPNLVKDGAWVGGEFLDYRMFSASKILNDIITALEKSQC